MPILFYSAREQPYGCFSNFSAHGFVLDDVWWPTSEHYFQAQKFVGTPYPRYNFRVCVGQKRSLRGIARTRLSESRLAKNHLFLCSIAPNAEWIASVDGTQCTVFVPKGQDIAPNGQLAAIGTHLFLSRGSLRGNNRKSY